MISLEFLITCLIVVAMPGTGVIYTVSIGLMQGVTASVYAAIGCTVGIIPSLLASVLGMAAIFHSSAVLFQVLKFAGVAYLLYLAWAMYQDRSSLVLNAKSAKLAAWSISVKGCLINILNPKLSIFFMAFLPQFVDPQAGALLSQMLVLGGIFMLMTLSVFIIYGCLANRLSQYILHSPSAVSKVQRLFAASFAALAAKLAFTEQ